jgi:hypothetical protein
LITTDFYKRRLGRKATSFTKSIKESNSNSIIYNSFHKPEDKMEMNERSEIESPYFIK